MPLYKRAGSPYWWVRIGRKTRCSTGTANKAEAEEFERTLQGRLWRLEKLGDRGAVPWREVVERWLKESSKPTRRDREIVIDRTCARCGCEYEWGVHVAYFAARVGLTAAQVTSLTHGVAGDPCWTDERDRVLIEAADALHDSHDIDDPLWERLSAVLDDAQLIDLLLLAGWYHAVSYAARATRLAPEPGAPRFGDVAP